ncbi:MAG: aminotransferase class III-fold pyridoxal phosphate-dependent enzyme [Chloroflexi bacterium]|nr:aminotransferase class III-fold pyridoxal phosphate-dependent enzyme [Chloroflexota bacterium]
MPGHTGQELYRKAKTRIPGGTQLLSKRPEMFLPENWPAYYSRAKGAQVWDLDGNMYYDMSYNGIAACILGAADPDVEEAVIAAVKAGSMSTLNAPEEVELADLLCELHPWAEMVRYARCGGEAMAVAVRLARAHTGRDRVAFCGYHGWHDWYLAANLADDKALNGHLMPGLEPAGVPRALRGTALPFRYNHLEELEAIVAQYGDELAAVVMEPIRSMEPEPGFLAGIRNICDRAGMLLVVDEVSVGWRLLTGGAHLVYGLRPDIAVFAKAISNGYPMAAIIGTADAMQAAQISFVSSTYWTERIGPAAALATIRKHRRENVALHLRRIGQMVRDGWRVAAERAGLPITIGGLVPMSNFAIQHKEAQAASTLFTQLMLEKGFLATKAFNTTFAHQDQVIEEYLQAAEETFGVVAQALDRGTVRDLLGGPVAHAGFARLN